MSEQIPLDEIIPGATVRIATINGKQYLSVRDVIMHMCDATADHACQIWRNLSNFNKSEVQKYVENFQFLGRGQTEQPVITYQGALKLVMCLPGDVAKKYRLAMANILTRYFAGDHSLISEIKENAVSGSPVCQLARSEATVPLEDDPRKRKHDELGDLKTEAEIRCSIVERYTSTYAALCKNQDIDEDAKSVLKRMLLPRHENEAPGINLHHKDHTRAQQSPRENVSQVHNEKMFLTNVDSRLRIDRLQSDRWPESVAGVNRWVDLESLDDDNEIIPSGPVAPISELKHTLPKARGDLGKPETKYHVVGFQYKGPRITLKALQDQAGLVKEAYGVEREGVQFMILVLKKERGVRADCCCMLPYRLRLIPQWILITDVRLFKKQETPFIDDPILDAIKAPAETETPKWIWYNKPIRPNANKPELKTLQDSEFVSCKEWVMKLLLDHCIRSSALRESIYQRLHNQIQRRYPNIQLTRIKGILHFKVTDLKAVESIIENDINQRLARCPVYDNGQIF